MEKLNTYEKILGDRAEKRIELEVSLPEYLPNCIGIVRVTALPKVEKTVSDGKVEARGRVAFNVLYASDSQDSLRTATFPSDFEHSFLARGDIRLLDEAVVECTARVKDEEGRVQSPRRLLLSCTVELGTCAVLKRESELFEIPKDETVIEKTSKASTTAITVLSDAEIRLSETIHLGADAPAVGEIVLADCKFGRPRHSVRDERCFLSGDALFTCIYRDAENADNYVTFSKSLPYTAELSLDFDENSTILCNAVTLKVSAEPKLDNYGDKSGISLSAVGRLDGRVYRSLFAEYCEDAFGTECEVDIEMRRIPTDVIVESVSESADFAEKVAARLGGITEIVTASVEVNEVASELSEGKITADATATLRILGRDADGNLESTNAPFSLKLAVNSNADSRYEGARVDSSLWISDLSAKIENGEVKLFLTSTIDAVVVASDSVLAVVGATPDKDKTVRRDKSRYVICYPSGTDTVWSLAKRYRVSPDAIKAENSMSDDSLFSKRCIVIPR